MIRRFSAAAAAVTAALLLCSCSFEAFGYRFYAEPIEDGDESPDRRPDVSYYDTSEEGRAGISPIGVTDYEIIRRNGMSYAYESISDIETRANVGEVLRAMYELETDVNLPFPIPVDEVKTFVHFISDYLCGFTHVAYYTYSYWSDGDDETAYALHLTYTKDKEQAYKEFEKLCELIDEIVEEAPEDEYEKIKFFYNRLTKKCSYDSAFSHADNGNAYGALVDGYAVCQGYANAMQLMLSRAGFDAVPVIGKLSEDESHKWNRVKLSDGKWYDIDATWDDSPGFGNGGDYKSLLVSEKTLEELLHPCAEEVAYFEVPKALDDYNKED